MCKRYWITIDGGTTNTRISLVNEKGCIFREKYGVGARNTANGNSDMLEKTIRASIASVLQKCGLTEEDIFGVVLSGMIGSEAGLKAIPHIKLPVGEKELSQAIQKYSFSKISSIPFYFIPGVKTFDSANEKSLCEIDIMRGEETELVGLMDIMGEKISGKKATFLLPGSHMKIIDVNENGKIVNFITSMSGELFRAVCENTILKASLADVFFTDIDPSSLRDGFYYADVHGLNETLFKVRVQALFQDVTKKQLFSFLLGAVLHDDVKTTDNSEGIIVVAGSEPFKSALCVLLNDKKVLTVSKEAADEASSWGAYIIADRNIK